MCVAVLSPISLHDLRLHPRCQVCRTLPDPRPIFSGKWQPHSSHSSCSRRHLFLFHFAVSCLASHPGHLRERRSRSAISWRGDRTSHLSTLTAVCSYRVLSRTYSGTGTQKGHNLCCVRRCFGSLQVLFTVWFPAAQGPTDSAVPRSTCNFCTSLSSISN